MPSARPALACLLLLACSGGRGLSEDGVAARTRLRAALTRGDVREVADAARSADRFRGRDAELDRLLGHALANVLMRPDQGLPLLEGNAADGDEEWAAWLAAAALRAGDYATMERIRSGLHLPELDLTSPAVEQVSVKARLDPALGWPELQDAVEACTLLDGQPVRGRMPVLRDAPEVLPATALALGATRVVMGRPERLDDHDPLAGTGDLQCRTGRVVRGDRLPRPMPRNLTVGATDGEHRLYVNVKPEDGRVVAYAASDAVAVERWLDAAETLDAVPPGPGWPGVDQVPLLEQRFGLGLVRED